MCSVNYYGECRVCGELESGEDYLFEGEWIFLCEYCLGEINEQHLALRKEGLGGRVIYGCKVVS